MGVSGSQAGGNRLYPVEMNGGGWMVVEVTGGWEWSTEHGRRQLPARVFAVDLETREQALAVIERARMGVNA